MATNVGNPVYPWLIRATIKSSSNPNTKLIIQTEAQVVDGYANFTNLSISDLVDNLVISYSFDLPTGVNSLVFFQILYLKSIARNRLN